MQVSSSLAQNSDILATKKAFDDAKTAKESARENIQNENLKANEAKSQESNTLEREKIEKPKDASALSLQADGYEIETSRETYGLLVLELMNDSEFQAFERATVGMTQGEKMIAAQSLYRLSELQAQNKKATFPQEQNSGYARTINFGEAFARALHFGEQSLDIQG